MQRRATGWLGTVLGTWRQRLSDRRLMVPAVQRGIRAAVIVPISFALGQATGNSQIALFSAFGAFALLLMVEVTGRQEQRLRAFVVMVLVGAFLVVVGTASSQVTAAAVPVTAVLVFAVLFSAVLSPLSAQATTATLLFLILSVAVPEDPDQIPARLAGVAIAAALSVPAAMLIWPPRGQGRLRLRLADTADALADLTDAGCEGLSRVGSRRSWIEPSTPSSKSSMPATSSRPGWCRVTRSSASWSGISGGPSRR